MTTPLFCVSCFSTLVYHKKFQCKDFHIFIYSFQIRNKAETNGIIIFGGIFYVSSIDNLKRVFLTSKYDQNSSLYCCCQKAGYKVLGLADHNVLYGALEFYQQCQNAGIKPVIGVLFDCTFGTSTMRFPLYLLQRIYLATDY